MADSSALPDARMRKTRAALNEAMLSLLEEKTFDQITIREIALRADVGYATFFRHFDTKEALLNDLAANEISHLMKLALPTLMETGGQAAALALFRFVEEHRRLWTALLTGGAAGILRKEFVRQAGKVRGVNLDHSAWLPAELATIYGVSATVEIIAWWLERGRNLSVDKIAQILNRLVIAPFSAPSAEIPKGAERAPRRKGPPRPKVQRGEL
jgi:AcrR family transcriptional regulator